MKSSIDKILIILHNITSLNMTKNYINIEKLNPNHVK